MSRRGFTLLEVMIAVAILGLSLTAIFSSEVGAANVAARARRQNVAATLARCKMGEIEQVVAIEGLPAIEKKDTDNCCEHAPVEGYECEWIIERIILPEFGVEDSDDEGRSSEDESKQGLVTALDETLAAGGTPQEVITGEIDNFTMLALQLGYPILKPFFEEQVRRASVTVRWKEGSKDRGFDVIQFLVSEQIASEDPTGAEAE